MKLNVIKIGGSLLDAKQFPMFSKELAIFLKKNKSVLIHGGGKEVSRMCEKLNIQTRFVNGRRWTDEATLEVVEMVLRGKVNPYVCAQLRKQGVPAFGLSGRDGGIVLAKPIPSLGRVGIPSRIKKDLILKLTGLNQVLVFASIAQDKKGNPLNINADEMAGAIAAGLKSFRLILFTDVPGILDPNKKTIPKISIAEGKKLIQKGVITGGMIPKIEAAFEALNQGIEEIWILEGKTPLSKTRGTLITKKASIPRHPFS